MLPSPPAERRGAHGRPGGAPPRRSGAQGPIANKLVALAWPLFVGNILNTFYNLADMYWVSMVGNDVQSRPSRSLFHGVAHLSLGMGVTIAGVAFVSQQTGAGRLDQAARVAGQVTLLAFLVGVILGGLGILFREAIVGAMGAQGPVFELASVYLLITIAGLPLKYIYFAYRAVSQGTGDSKTPRNLLFLTTMMNVVLDPFFILGWAGLPTMGVPGAAWATIISEAVGAVISLVYLMNGRLGGVRVRLAHFKPDWQLIKSIIQVGVPGSLDMGSRGLSAVAVAAIVSRFGTVEAAAYGIVNRLMSVVWTSSGAMEQATTSGVGQNLGAGRPERAERLAWTGAGIMFCFLTVVAMCSTSFPNRSSGSLASAKRWSIPPPGSSACTYSHTVFGGRWRCSRAALGDPGKPCRRPSSPSPAGGRF